MKAKKKTNPFSILREKYEKILAKNPQSRVFAPLAEIYRKYAMVDKALEILKEGIRYNPSYPLGHLGLSNCYYDQKQYALCYSTLRPLVGTNRDNLRLQELFANVCEKLDSLEEALEAYKYLLYLNPKSFELAQKVASLEGRLSHNNNDAFIIRPKKPFNLDKLSGSPQDISEQMEEVADWIPLNLGQNEEVITPKEVRENDTPDSPQHQSPPPPFDLSELEKSLWGLHGALCKKASLATRQR